jgi:hypothetical protein
MILTVSAQADVDADGDGSPDCNSRIFTSLSAAIESLPERINHPTLIEVGSHGNLGLAEIKGITFGKDGSLEIINRNFGKAYSGLTKVLSLQTGDLSKYEIINGISSMDLSATFSDASCLDISTAVFSSTVDPRTVANVKALTQVPGYITGSRTSRLAASLTEADAYGAAAASTIDLQCYDGSPGGTDQLYPYDVSTYNIFQGRELYRSGLITANTTDAVSLVYGSFLTSLTIEDCNGPVYIRGFLIDGETNIDPGQANYVQGVKVKNSSNILLENIGSVRNSTHGYNIVNSDVIFTRGVVAYRNYGFDSNNNRTAPSWGNTSSLGLTDRDNIAGLRAVDSTITLSSTLSKEQSEASAVDFMINFSRNANGVVLENSVLQGGISRITQSDPATQSFFQCELNTDNGIKARNSVIDLDGRLDVYNNSRGMTVTNSKVLLEEFGFENNQHVGVDAENSVVVYNKSLLEVGDSDYPLVAGTRLHQFELSGNGQHMLLSNSEFVPQVASSIEVTFGKLHALESHGSNSNIVGDTQRALLPAIELTNNSYARFIHSRMTKENRNTLAGTHPTYGALISARNNSSVLFQGSVSAANILEGPTGYETQKRMAGVYAQGNSRIEFNGPTFIGQFGVDALAEDNSELVFGPPRVKADGGIDVSSFDLTNRLNHTAVELHSTKACLVVNRGSVLNIKDVGAYGQNWVSGANGLIELASGTGAYATSSELGYDPYTSGGSFQFYPNPNDADDYAAAAPVGRSDITIPAVPTDAFQTEGDLSRFSYFLTDTVFDPATADDVSAFTGGGVCVRAVGESKVDVLNSHFMTGWWNPSSAIYDSSTGLVCDRTFIWNIADGSWMQAAYVSVSALHPLDVDYHGPSAAWTSGAGGGNWDDSIAYGVPSSTEDTSSLSVLDSFGFTGPNALPTPTGDLIQFGPGSWQNKGPFRIYVSPDSLANFLSDSTAEAAGKSTFGQAYQLYSQGYCASSNLSSSPEITDTYEQATRWNSAGTALTSDNFYHTSALLDDGIRCRIMLDKSAANMFANAKHGASGKSGRARICTIYGAHTSTGGEAALNANKNMGRGFKSSNVFDLGRNE